jgi:hypothetical protein
MVVLSASETKNRQAVEYDLPLAVGQVLNRYLEQYRPVLFGSSTHTGLWDSAKGVPMHANAIYDAVCRKMKKAFGCAVNLHLFRDAAATFWAFKAPDQVGVMSQLLGNEPRMTERHYNRAKGISAGSRLADALASYCR